MQFIQNTEQLAERWGALELHGSKPSIVAISGFGGSGKSTLAATISNELPGSVVVPVDDFIIGARDERSADWSTFDRQRLRTEVIDRATTGSTLRYQAYNSGEWVQGLGGSWRELEIGHLVIVEGCSVIHPELISFYDSSAWINCSQSRALDTAKARDALELGLFRGEDTARLWDEVWGPNDRDFFNGYRPDLLAEFVIERQF